MITAGAAAATVAKEVGKEIGKEVAKGAGKEVAKGAGKEVGKNLASKALDISKRLDVRVKMDSGDNDDSPSIRIDKRIVPDLPSTLKEIPGKDISSLVKDYINDLKSKSPFADKISIKDLDISKLEVLSPDKVAELRDSFDSCREKLRDEWAKMNNLEEWPQYSTDVKSKDGERILKKAGDYLDVHHIQPLALGGKNDVSNIIPLDIFDHIDIHSKKGSCKSLVDAFKENILSKEIINND